MVVVQEQARKAADLAKPRIGDGGDWGVLPAPALAFAVWLQQAVTSNPRGVLAYVVGEVWGMLKVHQKFPFWCQAAGRFQRRRGTLRGNYMSIIPDSLEWSNVFGRFAHTNRTPVRVP